MFSRPPDNRANVIFLWIILLSLFLSFSYSLDHSGTITSNETWHAEDNVHVIIGNITIAHDVTLTIEPGTMVKFKPKTAGGAWAGYTITVNGVLSAVGNAESPICFTSWYDDTIGGDTNGDGNNTKPSRDDWQRIFFTKDSDSANCIMQYCTFRYGGIPLTATTAFIDCQNASPRILDCIFDNGYFGIMCNVPNLSSSLPTNPDIQRCEFRILLYDGIWCKEKSEPLIKDNHFERARTAVLMDLSSTPTLEGANTLGTSIWKGIGIAGVSLDKRLPKIDFGGYTGIPYIVLSDITVNGNLVIDPGAVIKFYPVKKNNKPAGFSFIINGGLIAKGTPEEPLSFTSLLDDTVWGDTNDDGALTMPANSDWYRIYFTKSSQDDINTIQYCNFYYGGMGYDSGQGINITSGFVACDQSSPQISDCNFANGWFGIFLSSSHPLIHKNEFKTFVYDAIYCGGVSTPDISNNTFEECRTGVHIALTSGIDLSSPETLKGNEIKAKVLKGIGISGEAHDKTLPRKDFGGLSNVPYIVLGNITVKGELIPDGGELLIDPGVFIKFYPANYMITIEKNSRLIAAGENGQPIVFTSLYDDTEWGDTNYDNGSNVPYGTNWRRIYCKENATSGTQSLFQFCKFKFGGKYVYQTTTEYYGFIDCEKSSPQILDSVFDTGYYGVRCLLTSNAEIRRNMFQNLDIDAIYCGPWCNPNVTDNTFENCLRTAFHMDLSSNLDLVDPQSLADNTLQSNILKGIGISGTAIKRNLPLREFGSIADIPYIVLGDITVEGELSVDPGVIIKFYPQKVSSDYLGYAINVDGVLAALGTPENPVCFTSLYDDTVGGDTNNDAGSNKPSSTDWKRIGFSKKSDSGKCILSNCLFRYAGKTVSKGTAAFFGFIECDAVSPLVSDCSFDNGFWGVKCTNTSAVQIINCKFKNLIYDGLYATVSSEPSLIGSTFEACRLALHLDLSSTATLSSDQLCTGVLKGIGISGVANNTHLAKINFGEMTNAPFIALSDLKVDGIMQIDPGVILKFMPNGKTGFSMMVNNTLKAIGTLDEPIIFTSLNDDTMGGDTNNDKGVNQPVKTDWQKMIFTDTSNDDECILQHCRFKYGSGAVYGSQTRNWGFVECQSASPKIRNCRFYTGNFGIQCLTLSHPEITGNTFMNIQYDAVWAGGTSNPRINFCNFIPAMRTGVRNDGMPTLNAENNWWGSLDGPSSVGPGSGVNVSTKVDYDPWLTSPYQLGIIQMDSSSLDFHNMDIDSGSTGPLFIQISNIGTGRLDFIEKGLEIKGTNAADFKIFGFPSLAFIPPSDSRSIGILFDPSDTGPRDAEIHITTEDLFSPDFVVLLHGFGVKIANPSGIRDILLGRRDMTHLDRIVLDINKDKRINVADLIYYLLTH